MKASKPANINKLPSICTMRKKIKKIAERFKAVEASVDRNVAKMEYKMEVKVLMVPSQQPGVDVVVCFVSFELLEDATPDDSGVAFFLFRVSILCRYYAIKAQINSDIQIQIQCQVFGRNFPK